MPSYSGMRVLKTTQRTGLFLNIPVFQGIHQKKGSRIMIFFKVFLANISFLTFSRAIHIMKIVTMMGGWQHEISGIEGTAH